MHIGMAADHGGFELKGRLSKVLETADHLVEPYGAYEFLGDDDYPVFLVPMARAVARGEVVRGIAICGSQDRRRYLIRTDNHEPGRT